MVSGSWKSQAPEQIQLEVRGLLENGNVGGDLGDVNLSFNPIGRGGGEQVCKLLAQVFRENTVLHHLDLPTQSHGPLSKWRCNGFRENRFCKLRNYVSSSNGYPTSCILCSNAQVSFHKMTLFEGSYTTS